MHVVVRLQNAFAVHPSNGKSYPVGNFLKNSVIGYVARRCRQSFQRAFGKRRCPAEEGVARAANRGFRRRAVLIRRHFAIGIRFRCRFAVYAPSYGVFTDSLREYRIKGLVAVHRDCGNIHNLAAVRQRPTDEGIRKFFRTCFGRRYARIRNGCPLCYFHRFNFRLAVFKQDGVRLRFRSRYYNFASCRSRIVFRRYGCRAFAYAKHYAVVYRNDCLVGRGPLHRRVGRRCGCRQGKAFPYGKRFRRYVKRNLLGLPAFLTAARQAYDRKNNKQ